MDQKSETRGQKPEKEGIGMITSYEDLEVYEKSYKMAQKYPEYERYEIGSQLRRAAISIPLNIAQGSSNEVKVLVQISKDLEYITEDLYEKVTSEYTTLGKRINTLIKNWKQF